ASDQRPPLTAEEVVCCALTATYPPSMRRAGTSKERDKRKCFRIVRPPKSRRRGHPATSCRRRVSHIKTLSARDLEDRGSARRTRSEQTTSGHALRLTRTQQGSASG